MTDRRPQPSPVDSGRGVIRPGRRAIRGGLSRDDGRRVADRHYIAVVAAEARRLARQLRPPVTHRALDAPRRDPVIRTSPRLAEASH